MRVVWYLSIGGILLFGLIVTLVTLELTGHLRDCKNLYVDGVKTRICTSH
jgi:hypothetical protein